MVVFPGVSSPSSPDNQDPDYSPAVSQESKADPLFSPAGKNHKKNSRGTGSRQTGHVTAAEEHVRTPGGVTGHVR